MLACISSSVEEGGGGAADVGTPSPATEPWLDLGIGRRWVDDRLFSQTGLEERDYFFLGTQLEGLWGDHGDVGTEGGEAADGV
jgi:hypothetical protein